MIPDINLIPAQIEKEDSGSKLIYIILSVFVLLAIIFVVWQYFSTSSAVKELESEETTLQQQKDNLNTELETLIAENNGTLEYSVQFVESISYAVSPIIDEIQKLQPESAYLRKYAFSENNVTIAFDIETLNEVSQFIARLNASPYFTDVQVTKVDHLLLVEEPENQTNFSEVPRQETEFVLFLDSNYLATGGVQ